MEWLKSSQWRDHCSSHLQSWKTEHCEVIVYRHTVIRPGYCPFCLWDMDLDAEDRLYQWSKSGNLKQHIEERHMLGDQEPGAKPMCGCGQAFANERGLRHHLHDTHKLNKAIWLNPKLPRKRKRTCKVEPQVSSMELEERPKRRRERYYSSELRDTSSESSRSSSVISYFSATDSSLTSPPTTPGSDIIDPAILKPIGLNMEDGCQPYNQVPIQLDSPDLSMDEPETKKEPFTCPKHAKRSREDCAGNEASERPSKALRPDSLISPSDQRPKLRREEHHNTLAGSNNKALCGNQAGVPLTRAKSRPQPPLNNPGGSSTRKARQKLNTQEKRKLLELKGQKMTLRQIGPLFADIDTTFLRQSWEDMELPQRCTRSRANRTDRRVYAR